MEEKPRTGGWTGAEQKKTSKSKVKSEVEGEAHDYGWVPHRSHFLVRMRSAQVRDCTHISTFASLFVLGGKRNYSQKDSGVQKP